MPSGNLNQALKLLKTFIENTDILNQPAEAQSMRRYDISAYETETFDDSKVKFNSETRPERDHISILGDNVNEYLKCLSAIYDAVDPQLIDRKTVEEYVEQAVIKSIDPAQRYQSIGFQNRLSRSITKLTARLRAEPTESEVYLQVDGLSHRGLPMTFGKFRFHKPDEVMLRRVMRSVKRVMRLSPDAPATKTKFINHLNEQYAKVWKKKSIAITTLKSVTPEAARSQAIRELRDTLDVINFFADFLNTTGNGGCVSMPEEWGNGHSLTLTFGKDSNQQLRRFNVQHGLEGRISAMKFDKNDIEELNKYGFKRASEILRKPAVERTDREAKIFNAIRWQGAQLLPASQMKDLKKLRTQAEKLVFSFMLYRLNLYF